MEFFQGKVKKLRNTLYDRVKKSEGDSTYERGGDARRLA